MNFFEDQDRARKETRKLVMLFILVMILTSIGTGLLFVYALQGDVTDHYGTHRIDSYSVFFMATFITAGIICLVSLIKILLLSRPAKYVAEVAGARPIPEDTTDQDLIQFRNVVEEMSIASGTPMPGIFVMESEASINAFAAGTEINDAVIAVTRGTLRRLNRDELQGVVAHEFSHIFNGDMNINIKLIGYLAGLNFIFEIGRSLARSQRRSSKKGGAAGIGVGLMALGGGGMFLAGWVKSAISRQREYLADASSVQFTRNPNGIGGALKKISASVVSSYIERKNIGEIDHLFIAPPVQSVFFSFASHPPLYARLSAIYPDFDSDLFEKDELPKIVNETTKEESEAWLETYSRRELKTKSISSKQRNKELLGNIPKWSAAVLAATAAGNLIKKQASQNAINVNQAKKEITEIPKALSRSIHSTVHVKHLIFALMIEQKEIPMSEILELKKFMDPPSIDFIRDNLRLLQNNLNIRRMTIMQLAVGTVKTIEENEKKLFQKELLTYIKNDKKIEPIEFIYYMYVKHSMTTKITKVANKSKATLKKPLCYLLNYLSIIGASEELLMQETYQTYVKEMYNKPMAYIPKAQLNYGKIEKAFNEMKLANADVKEKFIEIILKVINHDKKITELEESALYLFCQILGVPVPYKSLGA